MLYLKKDSFINSNVIIPLDDYSKIELERLKRDYNYNKYNSFVSRQLTYFLNQSLENIDSQKKLVKTGINLGEICDVNCLNRISSLLQSNMSLDDKKYFINNILDFKDFNIFVFRIFNKIRIEKIGEFDIERLKQLDLFSKEMGVWCESSNILESVQVAENNSKVLKLAKKIKC